MPGRDIITIGASAGGVEALRELVAGLPSDLPAAVFVVIHLAAGGTSVLPDLLNRLRTLRAVQGADGQPIEHGRIYVAPPDRHLLVKGGHVRLGRGPRENRCRPAVDPLFRTAAYHYGTRVIGVVLSGNLDDGTAGLAAIKSRGGLAVVQDPAEAPYPGMPTSAVANVEVDHVVPLARIAPLLNRLCREPAPPPISAPDTSNLAIEADVAELQMDAETTPRIGGEPSGFGCPECGGALFELKEGTFERFRCRVGHAYSPDSLALEQTDGIEAALYSAMRALEENVALTRRLASRARSRGDTPSGLRFERRAAEAHGHAATIRQILRRSREAPGTDPAGEAPPTPDNAAPPRQNPAPTPAGSSPMGLDRGPPRRIG